jgi:hypothetical protein
MGCSAQGEEPAIPERREKVASSSGPYRARLCPSGRAGPPHHVVTKFIAVASEVGGARQINEAGFAFSMCPGAARILQRTA